MSDDDNPWRGIKGRPVTPDPQDDPYEYCPECRQWFDVRDLGNVFEHLHGQPLPKKPRN